jgi:hypothetical protein
MPLDQAVQKKLVKLLSGPSESGGESAALSDDAGRFCRRVGRFLEMGFVTAEINLPALHLACHALQLPVRQLKAAAGKAGRMNLRERCEQAAELMGNLLAKDVEEALMEQGARILLDMAQRAPTTQEARLLADAVNLDDFGVIGLLHQTIQLAANGQCLADLSLALEKREQYGYWDARLKDGFHFEAVRELARRRLAEARKIAALLAAELADAAVEL